MLHPDKTPKPAGVNVSVYELGALNCVVTITTRTTSTVDVPFIKRFCLDFCRQNPPYCNNISINLSSGAMFVRVHIEDAQKNALLYAKCLISSFHDLVKYTATESVHFYEKDKAYEPSSNMCKKCCEYTILGRFDD